MTMDNKIQQIVNSTLYLLVKHRNTELLQNYCRSLKEFFENEEYLDLFDAFFEMYSDELEEDDILFFQNMLDDFIDKTNRKKKELLEEEHLRKIKKQIIFFKKRFNWELGKDYSFKKGRIFMSKRNEKILRESIS